MLHIIIQTSNIIWLKFQDKLRMFHFGTLDWRSYMWLLHNIKQSSFLQKVYFSIKLSAKKCEDDVTSYLPYDLMGNVYPFFFRTTETRSSIFLLIYNKKILIIMIYKN